MPVAGEIQDFNQLADIQEVLEIHQLLLVHQLLEDMEDQQEHLVVEDKEVEDQSPAAGVVAAASRASWARSPRLSGRSPRS